MSWTRRGVLLASGAALGVVGTRVLSPELPVLEGPQGFSAGDGASVMNDVSQLSATPIHKHIVMPQNRGAELVAALRAELKAARDEGRPVNIGAARHRQH